MHSERVTIGPLGLPALLEVPDAMSGLVVFSNVPLMDRQAAMDRRIAEVLHSHQLATLVLELLSPEEQAAGYGWLLDADGSAGTWRNVADMAMLGARVDQALRWIAGRADLADAPTGLLGSRAGAAAALIAACAQPGRVAATVCCGGRLDLAAQCLDRVHAATLLIVAEADNEVLRHNGAALRKLHCQKRLEVIPHASWLFEEPGALTSMAEYAAGWFCSHLGGPRYA